MICRHGKKQQRRRFAQDTLILGVIACLGVGTSSRAQSAQDDLPDGRGKAEFSRICSQCHSLNVATNRRLTQSGWEAVVNDMVSKGARGTDDEFDRVVNYLGQHFGPNVPIGKQPSRAIAKPDAVTKTVPTQTPVGGGGNTASGKALVESNGCLTCHRINNEGSRMGPDLSTIGSKRSPERLKAAIVAPDEEVLPENRLVEVVLKDGTTVKGRILNHDALSVQLIDSNEQLRSFQTSQMRGYTILTKGVMPSYANKLSDQQVSDIVAYLSSLTDSRQ
jgi:putative heme-binding domain-containing protein